MTYHVRAEVWGGVTGHRTGLCKNENQVLTFPTREAAQSYADQQMHRTMGNPHRTANFSYTVEESC